MLDGLMTSTTKITINFIAFFEEVGIFKAIEHFGFCHFAYQGDKEFVQISKSKQANKRVSNENKTQKK